MNIATSIVTGQQASADIAKAAVSNAMIKADLSIANSVLLLLSSEFASNPLPAIKAAAKAANCTQVMGCSATGIFTEDDWVVDAPAVAAMVFGGKVSLSLPQVNLSKLPLLTLSAPNAINTTWLSHHIRYGGVSGDATGRGPFSVWQNAKGNVTGHIEAHVIGAEIATGVSHGLKLLTEARRVTHSEQFDILLLDTHNPIKLLEKAWKSHHRQKAPIPSHRIMALYADSKEAIQNGDFHQTPVISCNEDPASVTLAQKIPEGKFLSWAVRDINIAQIDLKNTIQTLKNRLNAKPDFGLLFSCMGRGPYFYEGLDLDLAVIKSALPDMPLLGFYGNGEIAHIGHSNQLLPYSAVLSLFSTQKP
ncbi:MAG: FIST C-terminal domain-containing protein [Methylotenera sp.]|nr:FIST C-terminal domain-containing protein [Methylotenera sp.]